MFDFYRDQRAEDCPLETDGDMLLYQWGTNDWGEGEWFTIDLTRQFIIVTEAEDEDIWQLSLTFRYPPTQPLRDLGDGNQWCFAPGGNSIPVFEEFVRRSAAFQTASAIEPACVELDYRNAG
jgi:hypothetical protein